MSKLIPNIYTKKTTPREPSNLLVFDLVFCFYKHIVYNGVLFRCFRRVDICRVLEDLFGYKNIRVTQFKDFFYAKSFFLQTMCSNHGVCECGSCRCDVGFRGTLCDTCLVRIFLEYCLNETLLFLIIITQFER